MYVELTILLEENRQTSWYIYIYVIYTCKTQLQKWKVLHVSWFISQTSFLKGMSRFISMILPPYLGKIPQTCFKPPQRKKFLENCLCRMRGIFPGYVGENLDYFEMRNTKTCPIFASCAKTNDKNDIIKVNIPKNKQTDPATNSLVLKLSFSGCVFSWSGISHNGPPPVEKKRTIASPTRASDWCLGITPKTKGWTLKMMGSQ